MSCEPEAKSASSSMDLITSETRHVETNSTTATVKTEATPRRGFAKLPPEIRCMIWNFLLPGSRVVEIEWSTHTNSWFCPIESAHAPCVLLSLCTDSREWYLRKWIPLAPYFGSDSPNHSLMRSHIDADIRFPVAYFNPSIDTLYSDNGVGDYTQKAYADLSSISGLTHLALSHSLALYAQPGYHCHEFFLKMVQELKNLAKISIICNDMSVRDKPWKEQCKGIISLPLEKGYPKGYESFLLRGMKTLLRNAFPNRRF